ncbi:hypothetical protein [Streptomyces sp. KR80]|uniref:hypothetical protein n=1 Tax=Streptomyces sp. KR80 TaxID=3457426 RepID=UPI003FD16832
MTSAPGSLTRHVRAAVFAAVCVVLAGAGHVVIQGDHIPWPALLAAFGLTAAAAWCAGGRRRGVLPIGGGLLVVQGALHLIFTGGQQAARLDEMHGVRSGHGSSAMPRVDVTAAMDAVPGMAAAAATTSEPGTMSGIVTHLEHTGHAGYGSAAMFAAHLLAAVCCTLWLWRGEAAFFQLLRCLGALAFVPLRLLLAAARRPAAPRPARPRPARPRPGTGAAVARLRSALLAYALSRRGPPYAAVYSTTALVCPHARGI